MDDFGHLSLEYYRRLADYRRQTFKMYAAARNEAVPESERCAVFRAKRDRLLKTHPHSPIPADRRPVFVGLTYYDHNPGLRVAERLVYDPDRTRIQLAAASSHIAVRRLGWVKFKIDGVVCRLAVYWVEGYVGGILIPFQDLTSGTETHADGRYVWDSLKGADLGTSDSSLVLDFNYACHGRWAHDSRLSGALPPPENRLTVPIRAGERLPHPRALDPRNR